MNWNEFQTHHKNTYGTSTKQKISTDYAKYKKSHKSPKKSPKRSPKASPKKVRVSPKKSPLNLKKIQASLPASRKAQHKNLEKIMKHEGEGRGSPTRYWKSLSPQRGAERHALKVRCGSSAFLSPEDEKYPVMAALRVNDKCEYVCQGLQSALNRSCQYGALDISARANTLGVKECGWTPSKSPCKGKKAAPGPM